MWRSELSSSLLKIKQHTQIYPDTPMDAVFVRCASLHMHVDIKFIAMIVISLVPCVA